MPPLPGHVCIFVEISPGRNLGMGGRSSETGLSAQVEGEPLNLPSPNPGQQPTGEGVQMAKQAQAEEGPPDSPSCLVLLAWPNRALASPSPHRLREDTAMGGQRGMEMRINALVCSLPRSFRSKEGQ